MTAIRFPMLLPLMLAGALVACGQQQAGAPAPASAEAGSETGIDDVDPSAGEPPLEVVPADSPDAATDSPVVPPPPVTPVTSAPAAQHDPAPRTPATSPPPAAPASGDYARVVAVTPVKRTSQHQREVCRDEQHTYTSPAPRDEHRIAGTVIGGVAGGVAGSQVGSGRGRDLATVAGAVGGAVAGRRIQEQNQQRNQQSTTRTETICETVSEPVEEVYAYDVDYEYGGRILSARLDHDPGDRVKLPVRSIAH